MTDQSALRSALEFKKVFEKADRCCRRLLKTDSDYNAQINQALQAKPDVLVLTGYYTNVGNIVQTARKAGFTGPCVGGDGWDAATLYQIGGKALDNTYFTTHYSPDVPTRHSGVHLGIKAKYNAVPMPWPYT
jgi:branched-chain amino acid transport system substrate-binding protein